MEISTDPQLCKYRSITVYFGLGSVQRGWMQYLFQREWQALQLLPVTSEVSPMIIKIIMKEYTVMRAIHFSCIEKEVCLFSIAVINAPDFYVFNSFNVIILGPL